MPARFALGGVYAKGVGGAVDPVEALQWYLLASGSDPRAVLAAEALKANLTEKQIAVAERRARAFDPKTP